MSPVAGFVRNRKHQFGRQSALNTAIAAAHAYPFKGVPDHGEPWEDPDVDAGSIDLVVAPHRVAPNLTAPLTDPSLRYNHLPLLHAGFFGDGVTPSGSGTAKTWAFAPASDGSDTTDAFTYEFGDDVTDDWFQMVDGVLESVEITAPEGLGALTTSMSWRFGNEFSSGSTDFPDSPSVPTALTVPTNAIVVYLKDGQIAIASDPDNFGTSQVSDALHSFTLRWSRELDLKRWANGDQSFDIDEYGTAARTIELECVFSKTSDIVGTGSESDAWMSESAVNRFVQVSFESLAEAQAAVEDPPAAAVPYSWVFAMPMRYYTRAETESGGNTTVTLVGRAFLDPNGSPTDFDGVFKSDIVNTLATL